MAEEYRFSVDADTETAERKLQEINKLMNNIDKINTKGESNYFTTTQKDMDKSMKSLAELTSKYKELDRLLDSISKKKQEQASQPISSGSTDDEIKQIEKVKKKREEEAKSARQQKRQLDRQYQQAAKTHKRTTSFKQTYSKNFNSLSDPDDIYNMPQNDRTKARQNMENVFNQSNKRQESSRSVKDEINDVKKLKRRNESLARNATSSGYMSFQQFSNFRSDQRKTEGDYNEKYQRNLDAATKKGQERSRLMENIKGIENKEDASQDEINQKLTMQDQVKTLTEEIKDRQELNKIIKDTTDSMRDLDSQLDGTEVKPERGSMKGMMYERAPAIGLATTAALGATAGGLYSKGSSVKSEMRGDVTSISQRLGVDDARHDVRDVAMDMGLEDNMGYTGQEMLQFQDNYISKMGKTNNEDMHDAMSSQAEFGRVLGTDAETTSDFFETAFGTKAIQGDQVKDLQDAFVGGIKESGMEGRQDEQLSALQGVLHAMQQGREVSNEEVMSRVGLQSILASSENPALQGEQGGKLMQDMDEGIRSAVDDPQTKLLFGQGTKYQGIEGQWELRKQLEEGASAENLRTLARGADNLGKTDKESNERFAELARNNLGVDMKSDEAKALMGLYREGKLDEGNIEDTMKKIKDKGEKESENAYERYSESKPALDNQSEATTAKQAAHLNDFGDIIKEVNSAMSGFPSVLYTTIGLFGTLSATMASTLGSFGVSRGVKKLSGSEYNSTGGPGAGGTSGQSSFGDTRGGGGGSMIFGGGGGRDRKRNKPRLRDRLRNTKNTAQRTVSKYMNPGQLPNTGGDETPRSKPKGKGNFLSKLGKFGKMSTIASGGAMLFSGAKSIFGKRGSKDKGDGKNKGGILPDWAQKGMESSDSKKGGKGKGLKGLLKKGKNIIPKAGPLAAITGGLDLAGSIFGSDKGNMWESIGSSIGSIGGGIGGAIAGAPLGGVGSFGTGAAGSYGGSKLGSKIGSWIDGLFGGKDDSDKKDEEDEDGTDDKKPAQDHANKAREQEKKEVVNQKSRAEDKKSRNNAEQKENLSYLEKLLSKSEQILYQARAQNGIMGNPPNGSGGGLSGNAGNVSGSGNKEKIWNYLSDKGMSKNAIAGVMGNLEQESGMDPKNENSIGAFGIAQWLGSRKQGLQKFAKNQGSSADDLETQLDYLWKEMKSGNQGIDIDEFNNMSADEAAKHFSDKFERPGANEAQVGKRQDYAESILKEFGNKAQTQRVNAPSTMSTTGGGGENHNKIDSNINLYVKGDEKVSDKVNDSADMQRVAARIQDSIYGSMGFHSKETKRA